MGYWLTWRELDVRSRVPNHSFACLDFELWDLSEMLKGDKYFELMEAAKPPEVMLAHKNRNSPSTYPTGLANKGFALPLTFSSAPILSGLGALPDALLGRRSYDNVIMVVEIQYLFQLDRNEVAHWVYRWRENAV
jgi:hypothetical protein